MSTAIRYLKNYLNMVRQTSGCVIHTVQINVMGKVQLQTNSLQTGGSALPLLLTTLSEILIAQSHETEFVGSNTT